MKYPRSTVWYIEVRPVDAPGAAAQMGSGVVVRLFKEGDLTSNRRYLLTCSHLLRTKAQDQAEGYGPALGEILCWRPGGSFLSPNRIPNRRSGECPIALAAKIADFRPLSEGDVPHTDRRASSDWVVLDVADKSFQEIRSVTNLSAPQEGELLTIIGYPSGYRSWVADGAVENYVSNSLSLSRQASPGTIRIDGAYETSPGVSGGGVFNPAGELVGIHRSQTPSELAITAVDADFIKRELAALGWQLSSAPVDDLEGICESSRMVGEGVSRLAEMAGMNQTNTGIQRDLAPLRPKISELRANLGAMQACKECHELLLHRAGLKVGQCLSALKDLAAKRDDPRARFTAIRELSALKSDILRFGDFAPRCAAVFPAATQAAMELRSAIEDVERAVQEGTKGAELPIQFVVQQIVRTMPGQLQEVLGRLAKELPFGEIARVLTESSLDVSAPELRGLMELLPLQSNIRRLVNEHLAWQDLDRELRLLEPKVNDLGAGREDVLPEVVFMSGRVRKKAQALQPQESTIAGVGELLQAAEKLHASATVENPEIMSLLNGFITVYSLADHLFAQADEQLLVACQQVGAITTPLEQLLEQLPTRLP